MICHLFVSLEIGHIAPDEVRLKVRIYYLFSKKVHFNPDRLHTVKAGLGHLWFRNLYEIPCNRHLRNQKRFYMLWGIVNLFEKYKDDLLEKEK